MKIISIELIIYQKMKEKKMNRKMLICMRLIYNNILLLHITITDLHKLVFSFPF